MNALARVTPDSDQVLARRPLSMLERAFYREGRTPFSCIGTASLLGRPDERRLRSALDGLQAKHPLLRCVVEMAGPRPGFALRAEPAPIPLRIAARLDDDDWLAQGMAEAFRPFAGEREPLVRLLWLRGEDRHEWLLICHHAICDGVATLNLLRELLSGYDTPLVASPTLKLDRLEDLLPPGRIAEPAFGRRVRLRMGLLKLAFGLARWSRRMVPTPTPTQVYTLHWQLDADGSARLLSRCRAEGVTIFAALAVAFAQAYEEVVGKRPRKIHAPVDPRKFLPRLAADALFGFAPGVGLNLPKRAPPTPTAPQFWGLAKALKSDLNQRIGRMAASVPEYMVAFERLPERYGDLVRQLDAAAFGGQLTLTNLGRLDWAQSSGGLAVRRIYSPLGMLTPTPATTLSSSSFGGCLDFVLGSDELALPREQAEALRQAAMRRLHEALGALPLADTPMEL